MPVRSFQEVVAMSVLPPPGKAWERTSTSLPKDVWSHLDRVLELENEDRDPPERLSRDKLMAHLLEWAMGEWEAERAKKKR